MAVLDGNYRSLYGGELYACSRGTANLLTDIPDHRTWSEEDWIASDDRVRGGHSKVRSETMAHVTPDLEMCPVEASTNPRVPLVVTSAV
jgi:hypothetical protein